MIAAQHPTRTSANDAPRWEKTLGILAGDEPGTQVELVQIAEPGQVPTLELRTQRDGGELGWVTLRRTRIAPGQVRDLMLALQAMDPAALRARPAASASGNVIALPVAG